MTTNYSEIRVDEIEACEIARQLYGLDVKTRALPGEFDFNFEAQTEYERFLLKISRPEQDRAFLEFQNSILDHVAKSKLIKNPVSVIPATDGTKVGLTLTDNSERRFVRLLSWVDGRLWSEVNPVTPELLLKLGATIGSLTTALSGFDHAYAHKHHDWVLSSSDWTNQHLDLFDNHQKELVQFFQNRFANIQPVYKSLRKSVIHGDVNDNNVVVSDDLVQPEINGIIDYGDANYSQTINELAIALAYAIMEQPDPLTASTSVVSAFHEHFSLLPEEIECLYTLVGMRLITTVTKSAINKQKEPDNKYLLVSEKPAWNVLKKWRAINAEYAECCFREACGFAPHKNENTFVAWAKKNILSVQDLFPTLDCHNVQSVDMGVSSKWLGHESDFEDLDLLEFKISRLRQRMPNSLIAGGYLETRPIYSTDAYQVQSNQGYEYRTVHLGTDFWVASETPIHAVCSGVIESVFDNQNHKDYGPTIIVRHAFDDFEFFLLYGHLSKTSLSLHDVGDPVSKGDLIGYVGDSAENGCWVPHLHLQVMLNMLGNEHDFPGACVHRDIEIWRSICPDPSALFLELDTGRQEIDSIEQILSFRQHHLGKGMSVSYDRPLQIVRGSGTYLIDHTGRRYLDTVNNVAHVGHEHPRIVEAAKQQISLLNTNTRYLHGAINEFAEELLATFPDHLSVVHFVNSGSEANELAIRMAKTFTGQKDMIAVEIGYHGNTNACVDVSSYKFDGKGGSGAPHHTHIVPLPDTFRGIYDSENSHRYAEHVDQQIEAIRSTGRGVAAFICESIISCGGQIELPENYLSTAYSAIRDAGGVCIADEVQTGCGRVGQCFWAFELHDVVPDIVTIGKPIGNGHPLGAVICTREIADAFANGMEYFNTFGGNPVSSVIGREVLRVISSEGLQQNALETGAYLKSSLTQLSDDFPIVRNVRGQGLFLGFELVDSLKSPLPDQASYLANRMRDRGILMSTDGKDHNAIKIKPPLVFLKPHVDELIANLSIVLAEDFLKI